MKKMANKRATYQSSDKHQSLDNQKDWESLPDAWERFERAVDDAVKHGPERRVASESSSKVTTSPKKAGFTAKP